ncbi:MAG: tRNA uridine-5-carboxymethylaminomethyl(34) synthesis GTPase MnmE [Aquificaceae bacterium]|nr:tRNA uridine-5-carboxymethylaminomethyl(34) synthesis GTPase MnmE [Aquificaceae bacterium]MCX8059635.1 tRNA uridine-5-carboxymethylaminomethyl(34) synthesis GTPase MnmE [Aquificaceae bacterium]MDW8097511.1 tRNA uridine-5-carboxymethylaminomethyl(34) synthesis GTPase MnmE [Aquificaceae bacterium]
MVRQREPIVAIGTPLGESAIGVLRLSGGGLWERIEELIVLKGKLKPRYAHLVKLKDQEGQVLDEGILIYYPSPKSYTGEDMVELFLHGNPLLLRKALELFLSRGVRLAEPGEFTKRAFLNGKMDLLQAEAVADLIGARSERALRSAQRQLQGELSAQIGELRERLLELLSFVEADIEFSEEDIPTLSKEQVLSSLRDLQERIELLLTTVRTGEFLRRGINLALVGKPNVGKSSLFNALLGRERAIVTPVPGTTRDFLQESLTLDGVPVNLIDTAGIRRTEDPVEKIGVEKSLHKLQSAHLVLFVVDGHAPLQEEDLRIYELLKGLEHLVVVNKADLGLREEVLELFPEAVKVSALTGEGLEELKEKVLHRLGVYLTDSPQVYLSVRHEHLLKKSQGVLKSVVDELTASEVFPEILMLYLREALGYLEEIIGVVSTEDILGSIFSRFCIGK